MDSGVVDSLIQVVAVKDSLLGIAATREVVVAPVDRGTAELWVQAFVGLGAVFVGAGLASWSKAREASKNRRERGAQMKERVRRILARVVALGSDVPAAGEFIELSRRGAELRVLWATYERESVDLHLVGDLRLRDQIEGFMTSLHAFVAAMESGLVAMDRLRVAMMLGSAGSGKSPSNILVETKPDDVLEQFRTDLGEKKNEAEKLLEALGQR